MHITALCTETANTYLSPVSKLMLAGTVPTMELFDSDKYLSHNT